MSKLAVITGGTRGIGRALLERFAVAGFDLATCSRNTDELTRLAAEVRLKYGVATHVMQA
ncbi:MAG: SDR family NAD(P)-dependent oxidoreductase, partial [Bacteroidetes bacterium]|nr:SDR family NAD(P)-dependent oxidoreductase [Bacteroidota bacterium]